jgi:nucleoside-diphosphate-sugar epimerase
MADKCVLVAGATGLVGYAAMKHFARLPGVRVIALSRRQPDETFGARWLPLDLTDAAACAAAAGELGQVTHLVYAALYERPGLISGWQEQAQVRVNDAMLRNLLGPLELAAPGLRHVTLLQGTKAYGTHIRPMKVPARENRSELREQVNFYWNQEAYLRGLQAGKAWTFSILRPVLIVGESTGSAMNVIPALGAYAALRRLDGHADLPYPGGAERVAQAVDADLLAEAIAWCGEAGTARGEIFNVTNGDVFTWPNVWPAIAAALGMAPGEARPLSLDKAVRPREADWARVRATHALRAPGLADFVGLSFEYADYQMGYGRTEPGPPSIVSTIKLWQAGFHTVMDTEEMFRKAFAGMRARRLLPPV